MDIKWVRGKSVFLLVNSVQENPTIRVPFGQVGYQDNHRNNSCIDIEQWSVVAKVSQCWPTLKCDQACSYIRMHTADPPTNVTKHAPTYGCTQLTHPQMWPSMQLHMDAHSWPTHKCDLACSYIRMHIVDPPSNVTKHAPTYGCTQLTHPLTHLQMWPSMQLHTDAHIWLTYKCDLACSYIRMHISNPPTNVT